VSKLEEQMVEWVENGKDWLVGIGELAERRVFWLRKRSWRYVLIVYWVTDE
jgi:hypothetical protein